MIFTQGGRRWRVTIDLTGMVRLVSLDRVGRIPVSILVSPCRPSPLQVSG